MHRSSKEKAPLQKKEDAPKSSLPTAQNPQKRKSSLERPPMMSKETPLRIVLLGKSTSENSVVGNLILGRPAFDSEAPPDVVERVGGRLKDRHVTLINSPNLLNTHISDDQITQTVRECVRLSDPGPHVVLLLLQHQQCSAEDQERVEKLQDSFSERLLQHTLVLSTQEPTEPNQILQEIIQKCSNRHFSLQRSSSADHLLQAFEDIERSNEGRHLISAQYEAYKHFSVEQQATQQVSDCERLNVLVCGSDGSLKSSISELILQHTHRRSESVRTDVDLHGRQINVLELPALFNTGLSEEEVMRQTLRCVSCCHPGVHAFLLIIPDAPLNNEDRAEMEEIQKIFSSRINKYIMIFIMQNSEHQTAELNEETQTVIQSFGGRHHYFNPKTQVYTLMENIEKMLEENRGGFYSTETFLEVQMKKLMKYEEMKKKLYSLQTHLQSKGSADREDELRIVILGKTGVGKSSTGNTILGRDVFKAGESQESVTEESQRESCEINGRRITVIDTPGLFDTELTNEEIQREIRRCISMSLPGPHVFIIVLSIGERFTKEEAKSVKFIQETFGEHSLMFTMVLFTRGDELGNKKLEECLGKPGSVVRKLLETCGNRFHVFNNNQPEERTQVSELLEKIDNMVKANGGSFYSFKMFREMEREKQEEQMKNRVRETEEEMKKLGDEKDRMKTVMEEGQQRQEKESLEKFKKEKDRMKREKEDLQFKYEKEKNKMKIQIEQMNRESEELIKKHEKEKMKMMEERQNLEKERKKREELKKEISKQEEHQRETIEGMKRERETFRQNIEEMRKEREKLQIQHKTETDRLMKRIEDEEKNHELERKRREEDLNEKEEQHKREMKEIERMKKEKEDLQSKHEKDKNKMKIQIEQLNKEREELMKNHEVEKERIRTMMEEERQKERKTREELMKKHEEEKERMNTMMEEEKKRSEELMKIYKEEKDRMKMMEEEQQNQEKKRKRREEVMKKHEEEIEEMKMMMEEERQKQEKEKKRAELMKKHEEKERMKMMVEDERQKQENERKKREEELKDRENQNKIQMRGKQEELEKQKQDEEKGREEKKQISDEQIQKFKSETEGIIKEKERKEGERQKQLEDSEKRLKEEKTREDQQKSFKEKLKLLEKQHEEERAEWRKEYDREKEKMMRKIQSETDDSLQVAAYRKLETVYSEWSWSFHNAMMEIENKLQNQIENEAIHEVEETDLDRELKTTSEEVKKSMSEFFEKDTDKYLLIQWKSSFETKIKELKENFVKNTKRKLNEVLQQHDIIRKIDAQKKHDENALYVKCKVPELKNKSGITAERIVKRMFFLFWEPSMKDIIRDTSAIREIDIMRDVRKILSDVYESAPVDQWKNSRDIFKVKTYSHYVWLKRNYRRSDLLQFTMEWFGYVLSKADEAQIRSFVSDVVHQTDIMIQSFNISKVGYNISLIQQLIYYINTRETEHEEGAVKYVFKDEFFIDLVYSICKRANKTITDQHKLFREANDPEIYLKKKKEEYYSIFQKYCHGAKPAAVLGHIICQKLKEPIEQSIYKKTARDLADEMKTDCESLNGNRSNLEKHILKTLAEEEDFDKYMNYINNPRDHLKSLIRDEVSRYISDKFRVSVLPKMKENIKRLQQKIMNAAHQSTEHVQVHSGDVGLWLKSFTQQLSDQLIFSEKDLKGIKHDDVDDFRLLEDVITQELPAVMSDISSRFNTDTFPVKLDYKFRPDELLIDHFCQCCWVQCPFCGVTCTNTIEDHLGDHSAAFHRVIGVNGQFYAGTKNLSINTCTSAAGSDQSFNPTASTKSVPWREYRTAGGVYADWSITPDLSELPYWKWFVCRFQKDLEKYYSKTFEKKGSIPVEWKKYTKQDAVKSLE